MIRFVILDRDGTLIRHLPYLHDPARVELLPTVREGILLMRDAGCTLFLHTNQSGIGRGMFTFAEAEACNAAMIDALALGAAPFARICIASESPDDEPFYRKPSPKFGREVLEAYADEPEMMCYIGDNVSDLQTADAIGCNAIAVDTGGHNLLNIVPTLGLRRPVPVFTTFIDAARHVVGADG